MAPSHLHVYSENIGYPTHREVDGDVYMSPSHRCTSTSHVHGDEVELIASIDLILDYGNMAALPDIGTSATSTSHVDGDVYMAPSHRCTSTSHVDGDVYMAPSHRCTSTSHVDGDKVTLIATIDLIAGYGNMAPHTEIGKVIVIAYALIGIPLTFLMLQGIGQHLTLLSNKLNNLKLCSKKPDLNKYLNMVLIILIGISLLFVGPTILFMHVEGWYMMDAIYYCFVTLSTIGFGDFIPALSENRFTGRGEAAGTIYRIVAYVWILFGLAYVALIISYISSVLVKKAEKVQQMSKARIESEIKQLQKELSKTKSNIFSIASNVAESVATGIDGAMKSLDKELDQNHVINENHDATTRKPTRSTQHSLFRHKKDPHEPVQLLSFRRNSLS